MKSTLVNNVIDYNANYYAIGKTNHKLLVSKYVF